MIDEVRYIYAGKWRRYNDMSTLSKILDIKTNFLNFIDIGKTIIGFMQSLLLFARIKPNVVFAKGGFVVVPIGYAARVFRTKLVTHDSDISPGLANRIISKWAVCRTVASSATASAYDNQKTKIVGIPISDAYREVDSAQKGKFKDSLGVPKDKKLVVIIGGSQGARKLNESMHQVMQTVLESHGAVYFCWIVGKNNESECTDWLDSQNKELREVVKILGFSSEMPQWFAASDVVITRGGATTLAEIVASRAVSIIVPASFLPGDHQSDNALELASVGAAICIREGQDTSSSAEQITGELLRLLQNEGHYASMQTALRKISVPRASEDLAELLVAL
jgi:UDP-N-acetylglucosamine--N-acetylmuramyl-(pentapeptide) pyrophosphoryl-undecaprenol N-acetylglucosamine transferase